MKNFVAVALFTCGCWIAFWFVLLVVKKLLFVLDPYLFNSDEYAGFITGGLFTFGTLYGIFYGDNHSAEKTVKKYGQLIKDVLVDAGCRTTWCQCLPVSIPMLFSSSRVLTIVGHFEEPKSPYTAFVLEIQSNKIKRFQLLDGKDFDDEIFTHVAKINKKAKISNQPFFDVMVNYVYNSSKHTRVDMRKVDPFWESHIDGLVDDLRSKIINLELSRYK